MQYFYSLLVLIGIYVTLSASFNLIIGNGGLISIAHPIFFALGAYTAAILGINLDLPVLLSIAAGMVVAMGCSFALSLPALRISGDYLLIASIGFQLGLVQIIKNIDITGGAGGLGNIPSVLSGQTRDIVFAFGSLAMAAGVVLAIRWIIQSPYGRAITAMRDDELAFVSLGRSAMNIKLVIFALGSGFAGLAGGVYAYYYLYLSPDQFEILQSATILTMVVVGGMGSTLGPVVGGVLLLALPQAITFLHLPPNIMGPLQGMIFTLLVLVFLFVRPQGLISTKRRQR